MPASPRLSRRLKPKDHAPLVVVDDVLAYMAALPDEIAHLPAWQHAAALALDVRMEPTRARIAALTQQIEVALCAPHRPGP